MFAPCVGRGEKTGGGGSYPSVRVLGLCMVEECLVALIEMKDKDDHSIVMRRAVTTEELKKRSPHAYIEFLEKRVRFVNPSSQPREINLGKRSSSSGY